MIINPKEAKRNDGLIETKDINKNKVKKKLSELSDDMSADELSSAMNDILKKKAKEEKMLNG